MNEHRLSVDKLARQVGEQGRRLEGEAAELQKQEDERLALLRREHDLHEQSNLLEVRIGPAELELESLQQEEAAREQEEAEAQRAASGADRVLSQFEIDLVRRQEALESVRGRIMDDFGLVSFEYAANVEGPVPLPFEGLVEELRNVTELQPDLEDQLNQRRARLRRLGLINPEAAQDYEAEFEPLFVPHGPGAGSAPGRGRPAPGDRRAGRTDAPGVLADVRGGRQAVPLDIYAAVRGRLGTSGAHRSRRIWWRPASKSRPGCPAVASKAYLCSLVASAA